MKAVFRYFYFGGVVLLAACNTSESKVAEETRPTPVQVIEIIAKLGKNPKVSILVDVQLSPYASGNVTTSSSEYSKIVESGSERSAANPRLVTRSLRT